MEGLPGWRGAVGQSWLGAALGSRCTPKRVGLWQVTAWVQIGDGAAPVCPVPCCRLAQARGHGWASHFPLPIADGLSTLELMGSSINQHPNPRGCLPRLWLAEHVGAREHTRACTCMHFRWLLFPSPMQTAHKAPCRALAGKAWPQACPRHHNLLSPPKTQGCCWQHPCSW